jgi:hypothetical protein
MSKKISQSKIMSALNWGYEKAVNGVPGLDFAQELAESYMRKGELRMENRDRLIFTAVLKELSVSAGQRWKNGYLRGSLGEITTRNRLMKDRMRPKPADMASHLAQDVPFRSGFQITLSLSIVR